MHQQSADVADVVFHACQILSTSLPAPVVAAGQLLSKHMAGSWDVIPACLNDHARLEFIKRVLSPAAVNNLAKLRSAYLLQLCCRGLRGRVSMHGDKLWELVLEHQTVFAELDGMCDPFDVDAIASGYSSGLLSIIRKGSVCLDELTEDAPLHVGGESGQRTDSAKAQPTTPGVARGASNIRLVSYDALSMLASDHVSKGKGIDGSPGVLYSTETLRDLRLRLAADSMMQCRTRALKNLIQAVCCDHESERVVYHVSVAMCLLSCFSALGLFG